MPVYLHAIETAVPRHAYPQQALRDVFKAQAYAERRTPALLHRLYGQSGIRQRHSVIDELRRDAPEPDFYDRASGRLLNAGTRARNDHYTRAARPLFLEAARRALDAQGAHRAADVTHVVTVSCTGFSAPGPDYWLTRDLKLSPSVQRYHLGFMGCYAAFPALRAAQAFCQADPGAVVLVVCAELCTLHYQLHEDVDSLIAGTVFADGAAAAVVSARPPQGPALELQGFATTLTPVGEEDMAWTIGDHGFEMKLSTYVPNIIGEHIAAAFEPLLGHADPASRVPHWAIHPGGRSILDRVQGALKLSDEQLAPSREVLGEYGNMSSPTVLFVLRRHLHGPAGGRVAAMAFGPGLTVETALLGRPGD